MRSGSPSGRDGVRRWLFGWTAQLALLATFLVGALVPALAVRNNENDAKQEERNEAEEEAEATHAIAHRRGTRTARGPGVIGTLVTHRAPRTIAPTRAPPDVRTQTTLPRRTAPPGDEADHG
ncbi:MAG TPA: hypothetical protein VG755_19525 [Nannocystaceae bacterium]|nr:hypothetical protein [Nannocystaceae bacterium]